ncbi:hypothetical protein, partial [Lysobacter capsici]
KVTKEKRFSLNQGPASAAQTRACATRDIHVPVAHSVHPARRPSGVLLLTRVTGFAALDELRGFRLKATATAAAAAAAAAQHSTAQHSTAQQIQLQQPKVAAAIDQTIKKPLAPRSKRLSLSG